MTDSKKTAKGKDSSKSKKLRLNKETLKDLTARAKADNVRGGRPVPDDGKCTYVNTGCTDPGE